MSVEATGVSFEELTEALLAKWSAPAGQELIREGAKAVGYLMESGPLSVARADALMFPIVFATGAPVTTHASATGERITLPVGPGGIEDLSHPGAW